MRYETDYHDLCECGHYDINHDFQLTSTGIYIAPCNIEECYCDDYWREEDIIC